MENLRKRINVRLVKSETDFLKYTSRPTDITHKTFGKNYAAIHEIKPVSCLTNQLMLDLLFWNWANGWCMTSITDLIKNTLDAKFLFTDTDSLTSEIKSEDA